MSHPKAGNIFPVLSRVLVEHGSPLKADAYPKMHDHYVTRMGVDPADKASNEFRVAAQTIGSAAERIYYTPTRSIRSKVVLSLLNESFVLMPEIDGATYGFDRPVRESGWVSISHDTHHRHDGAPSSSNIEPETTWLSIGATVYDNGALVLRDFTGGNWCDMPGCDQEANSSRQVNIIGKLGLRKAFENARHEDHDYSFAFTKDDYVLDDEQTFGMGEFLKGYFAGNEDG